MQREALNEGLGCDSPAAVDKHSLPNPVVGRRQVNTSGTSADHVGRIEWAVSKEPRQNALVGKSIEPSATEHRPLRPCRKRPENPPYGAPVCFGLNNWWRELHSRTKCHLFGQGEISSLELPDRREYMRGEVAQFRIGHIDDNKRIEQRSSLAKAVRFRKCRKRITASHDQDLESSSFDFIDQRSNRKVPRNTH
jgi:hypothetical protein